VATSQFPPAQDLEKIPTPTLEEPDYNEPVEDPDSGELPLGDRADDDEDEVLDDEPLKA
jgi:hypothetical protein